MPNPKKAIFYWICLLFVFQVTAINAQRITTFQSHIQIYGNGRPIGMMEMPDKGFLIAAFNALGYPSNIGDLLVFRVDSLGKKVWMKEYDKPSETFCPTQMERVSDSTFIVSGYIPKHDSIVLIKMDFNGNVLWSRSFSQAGYHIIANNSPGSVSIANDPNGGFLLAATTNRNSVPNCLLIHTNDTGGVIWSQMDSFNSYAANTHIIEYGQLNINLIRPAQGGGYIVLANAFVDSILSTGTYNANIIFKITETGTVLWSKIYIPPKGTYVPDANFIQTPKAIYLTNGAGNGLASLSPNDTGELELIKLDNLGVLQWSKYYANLTEECGGNILYDSVRNSLVITGTHINANGSFCRMDTSGHIIDLKFYPPLHDDQQESDHPANTIISLANGYAFVLDGPDIQTGSGQGYYLMKTDPLGNTNNCRISGFKTSIKTLPIVQEPNKDTSWALNIRAGNIIIKSFSITSQDTVFCTPFVAWFNHGDSCFGHTTQFYDSTYVSATSWSWNFGDPGSGSNNTSILKTPTHFYKTTGKYIVTHIGSNSTNTDTEKRFVTIVALPPQIVKDTTICRGDSAKLVVYGGTKYQWFNGALLGKNDSAATTVWAYPDMDTTLICRVTNAGGCFIYDTFRITVDTGSQCGKMKYIKGVINKYAAVTGMDTCINALFVDTASYFIAGARALLIEMKGAITDSTNSASFGSIKSIGNAGNLEYVMIDSAVGNKVYLRDHLVNKYDIGGLIQLVMVPQYLNVDITGTLKAMSWNGIKGGILAFNASGIIYLNGAVDVSGQGYRGGIADSLGTTCHKSDYYYGTSSLFGANKGEGVSVIHTTLYRGRGAIANGGGGGNSYISGGGGGANYDVGGKGSEESNFCSNPIVNGGLGGIGLKSFMLQNKIFPGGGGGSGFEQNSLGSSGSNGGGIIIISAGKLVSYLNPIQSNGLSSSQANIASAGGGGGAGGSVFLNIQNYAMRTPIHTDGGKGGNANVNHFCTGTGGGGSGGSIIFSSSGIPSLVNYSAKAGSPGLDINTTTPCYNTSYGADSGKNGGIITGLSVPQSISTFSRPFATVIYVTVKDSGHVQLSFLKNNNPDVVAYKIYRQINNGVYKYLAAIDHPTLSPILFTDAINTSNDSFSYHVFVVDTCGNTSNYSPTHTTIHLHDTVKGCEQAIYLNWNAYAGWTAKQYFIYRSINGASEKQIAIVPGNTMVFKDSKLNYHISSYCYRVLAVDKTGIDSSWSERTCGRTYFLDTAKIITATKTISSVTNGAVTIRWQSIAGQKYMSGTELFYSANRINYTLLATVPANQDSFVQTGINTQTENEFYYIKNLDSCGTSSDSSVIHKTMTLTVSVGKLLHKLNWTPYKGFKVNEYIIQKLIGSNFQPIDTVSGIDTFMRFSPVPCNQVEKYRIEALGYNHGEISLSDTMGGKALDTIVPNVGQSMYTICSGTHIKIGANAKPDIVYLWTSNPPGFTSTLANPIVTPTNNSVYDLTVTNTITGCVSNNSAQIFVGINKAPVVDPGKNQSVCVGVSAQIGSNALSGDTYSWTSNPIGFTSTKANPLVIPNQTTSYSLTVTNATGCTNFDSVTITVNSKPKPFAGTPEKICSETSVQLGQAPLKGHSYSWTSNPSGFSSTLSNPIDSPKITTVYTLKETIDSTGCSDSTSVQITVTPLPNVAFNVKNINGYEYQFTVKKPNYPSWQYKWDFGDSSSGKHDTASGYNVDHIYPNNGKYNTVLTMSLPGYCVEIDSELVNINESFSLNIFPNPFGLQTDIRYILTDPGHVKITMTDEIGRFIGTLLDKQLSKGEYNTFFNGGAWKTRPAMYFIVFQFDDKVIVKKVIQLDSIYY